MEIEIFIISYLKNDVRRKIHRKQVLWLLENFKNYKINILSMNFDKEDYVDNENIKYINHKPVSQSIARNILLEKFYNSNLDYMILMDDDCILYDYYDWKKYFLALKEGKFLKYNINMFQPLSPTLMPFRKQNDNDDKIKNNFKFIRHNTLKTTFCVLQNFNKYFNKKIYFDEGMNNFEDVEFGLKAIFNGLTFYMTPTIILKELGVNDSILFNSSSERKTDNQKQRKVIIEKWKKFGMKLNKVNGFNNNEFHKQFNQTKSLIYIPK